MQQNFLEIADMNEWLVDHSPRTLRQACQFLAWFQSVDRMWGAGGALGQLDELLRPYYDADRVAGRTDDEEVIWCIASLFFNDTHYSQIGGPSPEGDDLTSPVSFFILEAHDDPSKYPGSGGAGDGLQRLLQKPLPRIPPADR